MKRLDKYEPEVEVGTHLYLAPVKDLPTFGVRGLLRNIEHDAEAEQTTLEVDFDSYGVFFLRADCFMVANQ